MTTVREAFRWASGRLRAAGVARAASEAERLVRLVLGWPRERLFGYPEAVMPPDAEARLEVLVARRAAGEPLQYLIGEQEFYGRAFRVTPAVLIPRPETEVLVESVLAAADAMWPPDAALSAVDVGTGSGAIAVTLAAERPRWQVWAVDLSADALAVAQENAARHGVATRITFAHGSWLGPLRRTGRRVQVIVSNPPYIPTADIAGLQREVRDHEPRLALDGGADGLDAYRSLARELPDIVDRRAVVAVEVGAGQAEAVAGLFRATDLFSRITITPDLAGIPRVVLAVREG